MQASLGSAGNNSSRQSESSAIASSNSLSHPANLLNRSAIFDVHPPSDIVLCEEQMLSRDIRWGPEAAEKPNYSEATSLVKYSNKSQLNKASGNSNKAHRGSMRNVLQNILSLPSKEILTNIRRRGSKEHIETLNKAEKIQKRHNGKQRYFANAPIFTESFGSLLEMQASSAGSLCAYMVQQSSAAKMPTKQSQSSSGGGASQMLERVARCDPASPEYPRYTDIPPATKSYHGFIEESMSHCDTARERYTQVLIWCFTRRMSYLSRQETTSQRMRLIQTLDSLKLKLLDGDIMPFASTHRNVEELRLKPMSINPKNEINEKDHREFSEFLEQLQASKRDGIEVLDAAEKQIISSDTTTLLTSSAVHFEQTQLPVLWQKALDCTREIIYQAFAIEHIPNAAINLVKNLQEKTDENSYDARYQGEAFCGKQM